MFRQYMLKSHGTVTHGWIESDAALKTGATVERLDQPGRLWKIVEVGRVALRTAPDTSWMVGGVTARMR